MTERKHTAAGPGFEFSIYSRGKYAAELLLNGLPKFCLGRVTLEEKFCETGSLEKKLRRHESVDLLSIGLESLNILPFGCEYAIARDFEVTDGFAEYSNDISAMHYGRVGSLELEPLYFLGTPCSVEFLPADKKEFIRFELDGENEIYSSEVPLLMLKVEWKNGDCVEYSVGTDLWRHGAAAEISGATAEFTLNFDGSVLTYERRALIYSAETEPEKRPWRFKNLIAWRSGGFSPAAVPENTFSVPGCQVNPAARREVRRKVRSGKGDMAFVNVSPCICQDSGHVERPGRKGFTHFDLAEYVSFRLWANRQLMKSGGSLVFCPAEKTIFKNTVTMQNLQTVPKSLEMAGENENV